MPLFVADWTVEGVTPERLEEFHRLLEGASERVAARGRRVRYLRCTHVPDQRRCICLFEADDLEAVRAVNQLAQVPLARIGLAVEFQRAQRTE